MSDFKLVKLIGDPIVLNFNIVPRGAYSAIISYVLGDSVSYLGSSYVATTTTLGNLPTDIAYWQLLAQGFTSEDLEDVIGGILTDTTSIDFTYNDAGNTISAVVLPAGVDHNSLANLNTGNPHPQYLQNIGGTITGLIIDTKEGDQFQLSQDTSKYREGVWSSTPSGTLYTLNSDFVMKYSSHNTELSPAGNFLGRDETDACYLKVLTEGAKERIYYAAADVAGTLPVFKLKYEFDIAQGNMDLKGAMRFYTNPLGAFGYTSSYLALVVEGGSQGGLYACGRANPANQPFTGLSGWDTTTQRILYFGGGQWDTVDATDLEFWTAPTYTETINTGVMVGKFQPNGRFGVGGNLNAIGMMSTTSKMSIAGNLLIDGTIKPALSFVQQLGGAAWTIGIEPTSSSNAFKISNSTALSTNDVVTILNGASGAARRIGIQTAAPTAMLHLPAGTAAASTSPLKFTSGVLNTTAEVGAFEFLTDKIYFGITTGAARKEITLNDSALTSGRIPYVTTNGRLLDSANFLFNGTDITLGGKLILSPGSVSLPSLYFTGSATTGMYQSAADEISFSILGANQFKMTDGLFTIDAELDVLQYMSVGGVYDSSYGSRLQIKPNFSGNSQIELSYSGSGPSTGSIMFYNQTLASGEWSFGAAPSTSVVFPYINKFFIKNLTQSGTKGYPFLIDTTSSNIGIQNASPTALLHIGAGTASAGTSPLKFTSGPLNTTAEVGAFEFLTDKIYFGITTGAARKEITINDIALTSGRVPFSTTNGRLTDSSGLTFDGTNLSLGGAITTTRLNLTTPGIIAPTTNATNAITITQADGTTPILSVDSLNKYIGLGISSPQNPLDVLATFGPIAKFTLVSSTYANNIQQRRARGTIGSETAILDNDTIGQNSFSAYNGGAYLTNAQFQAIADGNQSGFNGGSKFKWKLVQPGSTTIADKMILEGNGDLSIMGRLGVGGQWNSVAGDQIQVLPNASGYSAMEFDYTNTATGYGNFDFYNATTATYEWSFGATSANYDPGSGAIGFGEFYIANGVTGKNALQINLNTNNIGIGFASPYTAPTAKLHIAAGSTAAGTAPLKIDSGPLMTTAESGAIERLTDKLYFTIATGAARKEITLNSTSLTSGRIPFASVNGRLTDDASMVFDTTNGLQLLGTTNTVKLKVFANASQTADLAQFYNSTAGLRAHINNLGDFSNNGGKISSEKFGQGAVVGSDEDTAIGAFANTIASGGYSVAVGYNASSAREAVAVGADANAAGTFGVTIGRYAVAGLGTQGAVAIGYGTYVVNDYGVAIGFGAATTETSSVAMGFAAYASNGGVAVGGSTFQSYVDSIVIGQLAADTAANQFVVGSENNPINDVYIGQGVTSATPVELGVHATAGAGTNIAGGGYHIKTGESTGTGLGGSFKVSTSGSGSSGSTPNALVERFKIDSTGTATFTNKVVLSDTIRLKNYTVATLPTGTQGDLAYVTDALAPSYLVAVVGGGSVVTPVFYNGTSWIAG